ncbi:helix-turn-helix domain-containing protein [Sphingobacterium sp. Mn56C]|uniref:AraC family transcriptional regulator n=1 Tax=Sphingobacterium sp. Mn56C TaxID=3395261 RepID=UPI003BD21960
MINEYKDAITLARFTMHSNSASLKGAGLLNPIAPLNTFVYNKGKDQYVTIDEVQYTMPEGAILPLVSLQNFTFENPEALLAWQFNREFYCIVDHDAEVGCVGFLFYGIEHPMFIQLPAAAREDILHLERQFMDEWPAKDGFQGEMLRTLLKQLIIKTTRLAKQQSEGYQHFSEDKMDLIRKFALQVESNYKSEHTVKFYADSLHKSPKTLSNIFALLRQPAPSKIIQQRIILEAKRYLHYTDKSAKEIAYELGFESPAHFSRFFKLHGGSTISAFKAARSLKDGTAG